MKLSDRKRLGQAGEEYAEKILVGHGYKIVEKNYRCRHGELDIIAFDKEILVFVEVRTKSTLEYGSPAESITKNKIRRLRMLAQSFLYKHNISDVDCRFDVVAVENTISGLNGEIIKNAFFF